MEDPKKLLIFKEVTFRARKMKNPILKKLLIFQEIDLFNLWLKRRNFQSLKVKQEAILSNYSLAIRLLITNPIIDFEQNFGNVLRNKRKEIICTSGN